MNSNTILKPSLFFSMTWDFLNAYIPSQHQDSKKTAKSYTDALTIFRRYLTDTRKIPIEKFEFKDLTYDFLLDYRIFLEDEGYKPATVNHRLTVVTTYLKYAASRSTDIYQIYMNAAEVPYVTVPSRIRDMIESTEAVAALLSAPGTSKLGVRDQIILVILYDTAIRADELLSLELKDVNLSADSPYLRIRGKGDKERFVALSPKTMPLLEQYIRMFHPDQRRRDRPFIYTTVKGMTAPMSERNLERIVEKYGRIIKSDFPDVPDKVTPHMLRRTRATGWYRAGVPIETIALILGHADAKTTRKSYAKPSVEMLKEDMSKGSDTGIISNGYNEEPLWKDDEELARRCGVR